MISCHASDPRLFQQAHNIFRVSETNPTHILTPALHHPLPITITITVDDPDGASASTSFALTVNPVNDPPNISSVANQSTAGKSTRPTSRHSVIDVAITCGSSTRSGH